MNQRIQQEIVSEDNLVYRLKRPLHKQGLFWAALVFWYYHLSSGLAQHSPRHHYDWSYGGK